jgi:NAD(P)H-dependent FMN reductase
MTTVISGTNRKGSICKAYAEKYYELLSEILGDQVQFLALEDLPHDWFSPDMYAKGQMPPSLMAIQDQYILPADSFVFVSSEYNGSFPGALKLFIDACTVREYSRNFKGKKAALVGIASGRAGNLRGMHHLAGVLNYLGTTTLPDQLPISRADMLLDVNRQIADPDTIQALTRHAQDFAKFI